MKRSYEVGLQLHFLLAVVLIVILDFSPPYSKNDHLKLMPGAGQGGIKSSCEYR